jgi:hypothetical protein
VTGRARLGFPSPGFEIGGRSRSWSHREQDDDEADREEAVRLS